MLNVTVYRTIPSIHITHIQTRVGIVFIVYWYHQPTINIYIHTCVHTHTYIYIYIYTHTYIHVYIPNSSIVRSLHYERQDTPCVKKMLSKVQDIFHGVNNFTHESHFWYCKCNYSNTLLHLDENVL